MALTFVKVLRSGAIFRGLVDASAGYLGPAGDSASYPDAALIILTNYWLSERSAVYLGLAEGSGASLGTLEASAAPQGLFGDPPKTALPAALPGAASSGPPEGRGGWRCSTLPSASFQKGFERRRCMMPLSAVSDGPPMCPGRWHCHRRSLRGWR